MELLSINNVSEHERIRAITSAFTGYALTWWQFRCENYETPKTWMMLKQLLRYDYVPIYHSILCEELQFLQQGSKSVKSYYEKMKALMLRCEIDECVEATENRFLHGLQPEIQNVLNDQYYTSLSQLFELACMAEKQLFHAPICKNEEQQIEEQRLVVPPCMPNILQDFRDYKQHETNEKEDVHTVSGEISEPTLPLPSIEIEIIGNNICETL